MKKKNLLHYFFVFLLFILGAVIFYYPILKGRVPFNGHLLVSFWSPWQISLPYKLVSIDEIREFFPLFDFGYESLRQGKLPFWNPYSFSGTPHLANWASAVFYPLNGFIFILGKVPFYVFLKLSAVVLAGLFTYLYLKALKIGKRASFVGAVIFAFSSVMLIWESEIWQSSHSVVWLPLILWTIEKFSQAKKPIYLILGGLFLAFSVLAGYTQITIYVYLFALTYVIFRRCFAFLLAFVLSVAFSAVHLLPAFEFFWLSPRKEIAMTELNLSFLLPLKHLVTFFIPDFFGHIVDSNWYAKRPGQYYESMVYVGVVPLVLTSLAFLRKKLRNYVWFFFFWGLLSLTLVFNLPTSRLVYGLRLPFLSTAIPIRIIFMTAFSFSVLAAFGISWWLKNKKEWRRVIFSLMPLALVFGMIALWLFWSSYQKVLIKDFPTDWFVIALANFKTPARIFGLTLIVLILGSLKPVLKKYLYLPIVILVVVHSFIFAHKYLTFTPPLFIYPQNSLLSFFKDNLGVYRFWGYDQGRLETNFGTVYQIASPEGYDPVNIKRYNQLFSAVFDQGEYTGMVSRSDAMIPLALKSPLEDDHLYRLKILNLVGVKLVAHYSENQAKGIFENESFKLIWQEPPFYVYENKKAFSRAFLVSESIYAESDQESIKLVLSPKVDLSQKVVLEEQIELSEINSQDKGKAQIVNYSPNKVVIKVATSKNQFLVLTDPYYPAWRAKIDNQSTKIYPANHAFRAVVIPPGEHEVVFEYQSSTFKVGAGITLLSLFFSVGLILLYWKHQNA